VSTTTPVIKPYGEERRGEGIIKREIARNRGRETKTEGDKERAKVRYRESAMKWHGIGRKGTETDHQ
jgi:hypothetical protein